MGTREPHGLPGPLIGRRIGALRRAKKWSTRRVAEIADVTHTQIEQLEAGAVQKPHKATLRGLEKVATAFGWPSLKAMVESQEPAPPPPPNGTPPPPDNAATVVSSCQCPALSTGEADTHVAPYTRLSTYAYPGYVLWALNNPRVEADQHEALLPGKRVVWESEGMGTPGEVFAIRVDDPNALQIATTGGRVGIGWRIFIDTTKALTVTPGNVVAAMSHRRQLVVGELTNDPPGSWYLKTGRSREPIDRKDVLGSVVNYHAPPLSMGRVDEEEPDGSPNGDGE